MVNVSYKNRLIGYRVGVNEDPLNNRTVVQDPRGSIQLNMGDLQQIWNGQQKAPIEWHAKGLELVAIEVH